MSYGDYLDYWLENYCKDNLKHRTIEEYFVIAKIKQTIYTKSKNNV